MKTNKLFIGGLSWNISNEDLKDICQKYGEVLKVNIMQDRETGKSRGFGFVEFSNVEDAIKAKEAMDGGELDGRTIKVDFAKERS